MGQAAFDADRAAGKDLKLNLTFTDVVDEAGGALGAPGTNYVLWIENSVLHFRRAPPAADANAGLALPKELFLKVLIGQAGITDLLGDSGLTMTGSKLDLVSFFRMLEKPPAKFPIVTPS